MPRFLAMDKEQQFLLFYHAKNEIQSGNISKSRRYLIYHAAKNDILLTKSSIMNDIYSNLWHISYAMNSLTIVLHSLNFSDELPRAQDKGVRILKKMLSFFTLSLYTPPGKCMVYSKFLICFKKNRSKENWSYVNVWSNEEENKS